MTAAISEALGRGVRSVICASTGNTAASAAAYAARAGLLAVVLIPSGKVASGKIAGAAAYGAKILQIDGSFDEALSLVLELSKRMEFALVNSLNPHRLEGQKTAAFEIVDQLDVAPDMVFLPVGNAGNITSYWLGFRQYSAAVGSSLPQLYGVQAAGAAPLVLGHPVERPETRASAIRIGKPARGEQALEAASESGGKIMAVSDQKIIDAQKLLAQEGIWVEPASAAGLAGLIQEYEKGEISLEGNKIVIACTGHGLKDPAAISDSMPAPETLPVDIAAIQSWLENF